MVFSIAVLSGFGFDRIKVSPLIRLIVILATVFDLFLVSGEFNPVTSSKVFYSEGEKINFLKREKGYHRFFLTPKTEYERAVTGENLFLAAKNWRDNFYGNVNIALRNI